MRSISRWASVVIAILVASSTCRALADEPVGPPWKPSYKIRPDEHDRLTAADVVGPDGIVYPDWRYAGVPGGIPTVAEAAKIEAFGATPNDVRDDSQALQRAVDEIAQRGGGAITLGHGTYALDHPVVITGSGVVIRGQGAEHTKLVFRYAAPPEGVGFFRPHDGDVVGPDTWLEIHAAPEGLERLALEVRGELLTERKRSTHWGGTFALRMTSDRLVEAAGAGRQTLKAIADWQDGRRSETTISVTVDPHRRLPRGRRNVPSGSAALLFCGDEQSGETWKLEKDGKRGDTEITLDRKPNLQPGDALVLLSPATTRWNVLVRNACQWGVYRRYEFQVEEVRGKVVRLNQPLRFEFPIVDGSIAEQVFPIRHCGVEDLTLVQTEKLWTSGILFTTAWQCWARGVTVQKAGRFPVYARHAKWCEIRDCVMDDAWYHGGGGTAYVGWDQSCDSLMENVTTYRMRHAPCVQWAASGNVIRQSTFHGSDIQWHAGWTNENLFEMCTVDARGKTGAYGYGAWASPPHDTAHGPNGPRNVLYNCDIRSPKTGLLMGGMNENWLILHNRFVVEAGRGIEARTCSFDHIIRGNVLALARPDQPAVFLSTPDCVGIELWDNRIYGGNGKLVGGAGTPLSDRGNRFEAYIQDPPRPQPKPPSIFAWQRR